jgi:hypothetical protein
MEPAAQKVYYSDGRIMSITSQQTVVFGDSELLVANPAPFWLPDPTTEEIPLSKPDPIRGKAPCGRNDSCYCDSGRKYKKCCLLAARRLAAMPELTREIVDRARAAFENGLTPYVVQDVD